MPYNKHELKRRAREGSIAQKRATTQRAAQNAGKGAGPKGRRRRKIMDTIIQPEQWLRQRRG